MLPGGKYFFYIYNINKRHFAIKCLLWSGRRGSNPQQPAWKAGTLPIELLPHSKYSIFNPTIVTQLVECSQATSLRKLAM